VFDMIGGEVLARSPAGGIPGRVVLQP